MKALKISLAIIVIVAIGAGIFFWTQSINGTGEVKPPENQFAKEIKQKITQLKAMPDNKFCKAFYNTIAFNIAEFHKNKKFSQITSENDQYKGNFESMLYSTYAEKFIQQAKTVFRSSEWMPDDLKFIQTEKNELKKSKFLLVGSPVDKEFTTIQTVLNKYNELVSFISSCKSFSYSGTVFKDPFPIAEVRSKISRAAKLRSNRMENEFVNNCSRLHDGLKEIPQSLFSVHVRYLDSKISNWSGMYSQYNSQSEYAKLFYKPLKAQVDELDNDLYNVSYFDIEYNRLIKKMNDDSSQATQYFLNKKK
jgi:ATP-dependent Lon protease